MLSGPVLVAVAHPDDEVLGCGGMISRLAEKGIPVGVVVLSGGAGARNRRPSEPELLEDLHSALGIIGAELISCGDFPNIELNTVPDLELTRFIEDAIDEFSPATLITHHPSDLNVDHRCTATSAMAASRLAQRRGTGPTIDAVLLMEVLSATDWSFPQLGSSFSPTFFFEIGEAGLDAKRRALAAYRNVMRPYPHPRSDETLNALATLRGAQAGLDLAEAFEVAFVTQRCTQ